MGKDKSAQRTKNNARPSSSGRSAEMLGTAPLNPFMSFTSLKESMGVDEQTADSHLDPNFQVVLKKMNKKDSVTKLKALQEFSQLCNTSEADQVVAILPFWPRLYSQLALDVEHRVREAAHVAHQSVISKVKRNIAPYLKQLAGPWFVAQCDTYAPAASAASVAFNETFPPQKLSEAIAFCQEEILSYIFENLIVHTPQTLCNAKTMTPEEIEAKYIRTVTSSLQGYGLYLTRLTKDQLHSAKDLNQKLVSDSKFWKFSKHQSSQVRSAWFSALRALCQSAQFLIVGEEKRVGQAVFGSLDESDAAVLPVVWEAALVALVAIDGLLEVVSFEKLVLPKLLRVCREGGKGSAAAIFPSLLPLLSKIPSHIVKDTQAFHSKFFSSIRQGFSQRTVQISSSESKAVAKAFVECLQYVIQLNQDKDTFGVELLQQQLLPFLSNTLQSGKRAHTNDSLYLSVSNLLHSWGRCSKDSHQRKLLHLFCCDLLVALESMALNEKAPESLPDSEPNHLESTDSVNNDIEDTKLEDFEPTQVALKDILKSQVDFITCILQKRSRSFKVKFADVQGQEDLKGNADTSKTNFSEFTHGEFEALGKALCCCYVKSIVKSECSDYLPPLASLVKVLNVSSIYSDMALSVNLSSEQELFSKHFINWLKPQSPLCCRSAVSLSLPLLCQLSTEQQNQLLEQLLKDGLEVKQLLWLVEETTLYHGVSSNWLRSASLTTVLKTLTEEACLSDHVVLTWDLLSGGCDFAADGDHIFCHSALKEMLDVIVTHLEETWHSSTSLPPWTAAAVKTVSKLYTEQSPFLRTLLLPERLLSLAFEICLWSASSSSNFEAVSTLWKGGARALARLHGCSSAVVLELCSSLVDAILALLYGKLLHPKDDLKHAASQLAEFVEIVTDSFADIDEDQQRRTVCSTLLTSLFGRDGICTDSEEKPSGLKAISALHRRGLESLADCVEPFHIGIDSSQSIPRSPLTEIVGAGYWNAIVAFVIEQLTSVSSFENFDDGADETFFSWEIFLDTYVLFCDVRYIAHHFSSTELGSALHQLTKDSEHTIEAIVSTFNVQRSGKFHNFLIERSEKNAAYERAHRTWHESSCSSSCHYGKQLLYTHPSIDDDTLKTIDLSPLDLLSERLFTQGLDEKTRPVAVFWLGAVYKLHIQCNWRLVSNTTIDMCALTVVHDTVRVMTFLSAVVSHAPEILEGRNWDQVMVAVATWLHCAYESIMEKPVEEGITSRLSRKVCAYLLAVCKLLVSFNQNLLKLESGSIELVDAERGSLKETLPREWRDVFAKECEHKILAIWTDTVENIKPSEESPPVVALLDGLGEALQHSSTAFLQSSKEAEVDYESLLKFAPPYLLHNLGSVRLAAFHLLLKIIPHMVNRDAASLADFSADEQDGQSNIDSEDRISLLQFEDILVHAQTVVSTMLSDVRLGTCCTVEAFSDSYTYTSGYLLVWCLVLEMCREAKTELKSQYAIWLKNASENFAETLLNNVFRLLPQEAFDEKLKKPLDYFTNRPKMSFGDCWSSSLLEQMSCNVLFGALSCLPAMARQWWTNAEPKTAALIDRVVSKYLSPSICAAEMNSVAKMQDQAVENMSVRVHSKVREVVATYSVDDLTMELVVRLPVNHPLMPMVVEVGKRNAAAAVQWRQWLMQLTMFLTHQNGTLWDGLALWRNNVVRKYEGVEECYICFCVLSGSNFQLPKLSCRTCRKKFHSTCLYKWFQTSNKSSCPICRNLF